MKAIKVSELNKYINKIFQMDFMLMDLLVEGEISNLKVHGNGNIYFSLKDDKSRISAIIYESDAKNINMPLADGQNVKVRGRVTYFEKEGIINIYVTEIENAGVGDLYKKYLDLKNEFYKKGYFSQKYKKEIKRFPRSVGIITSDTSAAIKDILNLLRMRNDLVNIYIYPSLVQGSNAVNDLIRGLKYFNENLLGEVDTIIIGRGGGSFEDLFAFSDRNLCIEILKSKIPVISAVGHEVDTPISDFVADFRAATPTKAAEVVTVSKKELKEELLNKFYILNNEIILKLREKKHQILSIYKDLNYYNPLNDIENKNYRLRENYFKLSNNLEGKLNYERNRLKYYSHKLESFDFNLNNKKLILENYENKLNHDLLNNLKLKEIDLKNKKNILNYIFRKNVNLEFNRCIDLRNRLKKLDIYSKLNGNVRLLNSYKDVLINGLFSLDFYGEENKVLNLKKRIDNIITYKIKMQKRYLQYKYLELEKNYEMINKIVIKLPTGKKIKSIKDINVSDNLTLMAKDGKAELKVMSIYEKKV